MTFFNAAHILFLMSQRKSQKFARLFVRPIGGMSAELQHRLCKEAAEKHNLDLTATYEASWKSDPQDERGAFVRDLRKDEIALVARLDVLGRKRALLKGRRPTVDFITVLGEMYRRSEYIIEVDSGVTSQQNSHWKEQVEAAVNRISQGRTMTQTEATAKANKGWEERPRSVVEEWRRPERAAERERWSQHWRDRRFRSAKIAFEKLPKKLREEFVTWQTANKILGPRLPPGSGLGRPRNDD